MSIQLLLRNFRNIEELSITFKPGVNWITGPNGSGKSSILEALICLSTGRSFRALELAECIQQNNELFFISSSFSLKERIHDISLGYSSQAKKLHHNGSILHSLSQLLGIIPTTLFAPKDIELIDGMPSERRRFLNIFLSQAHPLYLFHLSRYSKALKQKNALLKTGTPSDIDIWDYELAKSASAISIERTAFFNEFLPLFERFSELLLGSSAQIRYKPNPTALQTPEEWAIALKKARSKELLLKCALIGPHRDDFSILFHGNEAKHFASEGQKRLLTTVFKLAEWELLSRKTDISPLFCCDDFGIHLDQENKERVFSMFSHIPFVIVTSPEIPRASSLNQVHEISLLSNKSDAEIS